MSSATGITSLLSRVFSSKSTPSNASGGKSGGDGGVAQPEPQTLKKNPKGTAAETRITNETLFELSDPCTGCAISSTCADSSHQSGYGRAFDRIGIDTKEEVWGLVKPYSRHVLVATGATDWQRDVVDIKGSLMAAIHDRRAEVAGKLMISACDIPLHQNYSSPSSTFTKPSNPDNPDGFTNGSKYGEQKEIGKEETGEEEVTVIVLPSFTKFSTTTKSTDSLIKALNDLPTTISPLIPSSSSSYSNTASYSSLNPSKLPHKALILICSHRRRDARCGISAPLLKREFEKHLLPLGLWRDQNDTRPDGVSVVFINHIGGHKFAANVIVYRREDGQGIWLSRVMLADVEAIVKETVLAGRVTHVGGLRGGFNRKRGVVSW